MHEREYAAARARWAAAVLETGKGLSITALAFSLFALGLLYWGPGRAVPKILFGSALAAGMLSQAQGVRVAFDRKVFLDWARSWEGPGEEAPETTIAAFDAALEEARFHRPAGRSLENRIHGALGLLKAQALLLALQLALLTGAVFISPRENFPTPQVRSNIHGL